MSTKVTLNPSHRYATTTTAQQNVANVSSLLLAWRTPDNTVLRYGEGIDGAGRGAMFPTIKLYDSSGDEIDRDSKIMFAARAAQDSTKREFVTIGYGVFADLTSAEQRSTDYKSSVRTLLGAVARITEGNSFEVHIDSPDVVDLTQSKTVFELPASEVRL